MKPDLRFSVCPPCFWAAVRYLSQEAGYGAGGVALSHDANRIIDIFAASGLDTTFLKRPLAESTMVESIVDYLVYRAKVLNEDVQGNLMNASDAERTYAKLEQRLKPSCPLPMNKQKGEKRNHAFLTCIVNMLLEHHCANHPVDFDPHSLVMLTRGSCPEITLSRRPDGCFPAAINPIAIWEIKEYYYTTTFGSRVADGVYESLLDGLELRDAETGLKRHVGHYLFIDGQFTWWQHGKPYLCRIVDMLNMGLVDEVLVGREVINRLPQLADEWVQTAFGVKVL